MSATDWTQVIASPAYRDAVHADAATISGHVEVLALDGTVLATLGGPDATHPGVIGGEVSWDGGQDVAYDVSLDIDSDELVPRDEWTGRSI